MGRYNKSRITKQDYARLVEFLTPIEERTKKPVANPKHYKGMNGAQLAEKLSPLFSSEGRSLSYAVLRDAIIQTGFEWERPAASNGAIENKKKVDDRIDNLEMRFDTIEDQVAKILAAVTDPHRPNPHEQ